MSPMTKAMGALVGVNTQAAAIIMLGFWVQDYLEKEYPLSFSWAYIIVPVMVVAVFQLYYVMIRYLMRLDAEMRKQDKDKKGP